VVKHTSHTYIHKLVIHCTFYINISYKQIATWPERNKKLCSILPSKTSRKQCEGNLSIRYHAAECRRMPSHLNTQTVTSCPSPHLLSTRWSVNYGTAHCLQHFITNNMRDSTDKVINAFSVQVATINTSFCLTEKLITVCILFTVLPTKIITYEYQR